MVRDWSDGVELVKEDLACKRVRNWSKGAELVKGDLGEHDDGGVMAH